MNNRQALLRLIQLCKQVAMESEKYKLYVLILNAPRVISAIILLISIFQLTPLYKLDLKLQIIFGYGLVVFSLISFILEFLSERKQNLIDVRKKFDRLLSEFRTFYIKIENSKQKDINFLACNEQIEAYEIDFNESKLQLNFIPSGIVYSIVKKKKTEGSYLWILEAEKKLDTKNR
ncbi:hypothetical protein [Paenibacillus massiliensis]|uniref:hypothetical protein n=1 Tax=Paenibacillus massiliensis TaxID=225917 RepID=UPI00048C48F8|nr:hypothetical protein [Paenibacillus massiliensis]